MGLWPPKQAPKPYIRGREQEVIEVNGGARSGGGSSRNMINGVSKFNPFGPGYLDDATTEFGVPVSKGYCICK